MHLICQRCNSDFESATFLGYCQECREAFKRTREKVHASQRPAPGVIADGQFADPKESPRSVWNPVEEINVCGLCGSSELSPGYGLGSGYGMGSYTFCDDCCNFLDFSEDTGE